jgi:Ser/Thr protein kinase RdoA (MazF antagonist)
MKRLTTTEHLRKNFFTAATGRRAVEHPPQPGFHWRRGFALSVVKVTGHLPTPRSWGTRVSRGGLSMTKDASFKKAVRRHAEETGERYTEALSDLEGLGARMHHEPVAERLLAHLRDRYGIDPVAATKLSVHKTYVFRIDRKQGDPWVARAFPPARPRAGAEGDAAILGFLERQDYPAERLAVDDAVSDLGDSAVLVTRFVEGGQLPDSAAKFAMMGELLGRLHALPYDDSASRPGGASGEDPRREGSPRQDLLAALSFLDAVDTKVTDAERERFERLRDRVRSADDGHGLPEGLLHGNLLHAPDHAVLSEQGPVAINWKASGRGPRLADFAYLIWGAGSWNPRQPNQERIAAAVRAYRRHVEPTDDELDRLEPVMYIRTLYLACFGYRRAVENGVAFNEWGFIVPREYFRSAAAATRAAFGR